MALLEDEDLAVLDEMNNEELGVLVGMILKRGELSELLSTNDLYKAYQPNHKMYIGVIKEELQLMGGNTLANIARGHGVAYRELLQDVCKNQKVPFNEKSSVDRFEQCLIEKVLENTWDKMSAEERAEFLKSAGGDFNVKGQTGAAILIGLFRAGGFASYKILLTLVNGLAVLVLNRGLSIAANAALTKVASIFTGPIGMALTALWTLSDVVGPAYRVTVPAVIYIAAMRVIKNQEKYQNFTL